MSSLIEELDLAGKDLKEVSDILLPFGILGDDPLVMKDGVLYIPTKGVDPIPIGYMDGMNYVFPIGDELVELLKFYQEE